MTSDTIIKTVFFTAQPDTVWSFLTDKDKLALWFHGAKADLEAGKDYQLGTAKEGAAIIWGTILRFEPFSLLKYTFIIPPLIEVVTTVTWQLEEFQGGTKLTMHHEGVGELEEGALELMTHLDSGWDEHLGRLRVGVSEAQAS